MGNADRKELTVKMEEWTKSLTGEQRASIEACKSNEERLAFCKEHKIALPDEVLNGIAGGMSDTCYMCAKYDKCMVKNNDVWLCIDWVSKYE